MTWDILLLIMPGFIIFFFLANIFFLYPLIGEVSAEETKITNYVYFQDYSFYPLFYFDNPRWEIGVSNQKGYLKIDNFDKKENFIFGDIYFRKTKTNKDFSVYGDLSKNRKINRGFGWKKDYNFCVFQTVITADFRMIEIGRKISEFSYFSLLRKNSDYGVNFFLNSQPLFLNGYYFNYQDWRLYLKREFPVFILEGNFSQDRQDLEINFRRKINKFNFNYLSRIKLYPYSIEKNQLRLNTKIGKLDFWLRGEINPSQRNKFLFSSDFCYPISQKFSLKLEFNFFYQQARRFQISGQYKLAPGIEIEGEYLLIEKISSLPQDKLKFVLKWTW